MGKNEASTFINHQSPHQLENQFAIINSQLELTTLWPQLNAFEASTLKKSQFHICSFHPLKNQVPRFCKVANGRIDYIATPDFLPDFDHISVEAGTARHLGKQSVFRRIPSSRALGARTPSSGASCSSLDRVQSVMPSRVHHGGASPGQKAWVRTPACS